MLSIVGIVAIVVFTIQVYKTASGTERNGPAWAAVNLVIGIGIQFVLPMIIGIVIGIYYIASGTPVEQLESEITTLATFIGIFGIVLSIVGMWLIMKHVSKVKDDDPKGAPPPPPTFSQNL